MKYFSEIHTKTLISPSQIGKIFLIISLSYTFLTPNAHAFGKKRKKPQPQVTETIAYPTRVISMGTMRSTPFKLPDGVTNVDMAIFMPDLITNAVTNTTTKLRSRGAMSVGFDCAGMKKIDESQTLDRFVMCGGLSAFEADIFIGGVKLGYRPGVGDISNGKLAGGEGRLRVNIGRLEMDFQIYDTVEGTVVAAGHGDALMGRGKLEVELDFGQIKNDWDFVYNSPMTPIFRKVIADALKMIVNNPRTNLLMAWSNKIIRLDPTGQSLFMDAGLQDDIQINNLFTVVDHQGYRIGEAKVSQVQLTYSILKMVFRNPQNGLHDEDSSGRLFTSVREGDGVELFFNQIAR